MVNLPVEYSDKQVTPFGGMCLMKRLLDQTGVREFLNELDLPHPISRCNATVTWIAYTIGAFRGWGFF
jgi:hypothetical protein